MRAKSLGRHVHVVEQRRRSGHLRRDEHEPRAPSDHPRLLHQDVLLPSLLGRVVVRRPEGDRSERARGQGELTGLQERRQRVGCERLPRAHSPLRDPVRAHRREARQGLVFHQDPQRRRAFLGQPRHWTHSIACRLFLDEHSCSTPNYLFDSRKRKKKKKFHIFT